MTEQPTKKAFFGKLETREDALKTVRDAAYACFFVAALLAVLSFAFGRAVFIDVGIYLVVGLMLFFLRSRVAAVAFVMVASVSLGVTAANLAGAQLGGGSNIIVAVLMFYAAIRSVEATFKLRGRFAVHGE
jgi:hypothetical protein